MQSKVILITGASSGIGKGLALAYAKEGVTLLLTGRNTKRLQAVTKACEQKGAQVIAKTLAVEDTAAMSDWITAQDEQTPIDKVIANAGISKTGAQITDAEKRLIYEINLFGVLNTIDPLIPRMQERRRGQIVLMSSIAGFYGFPPSPAYCASKAAIKSLGQALRGRLYKEGIQVNVVCPGFVDTPLTQKNPFPMPFIMSVDKAVGIIQRGLAKNKALIAFPWRMHFFMWLLNAIPPSLADRIVRRSI